MGPTETSETECSESYASRSGSGSTFAGHTTRVPMLQSCGGGTATWNIPADRPLLAASRKARMLCGQYSRTLCPTRGAYPVHPGVSAAASDRRAWPMKELYA